VADASNEIGQLHATISALRDELERQRIGHNEEMQELKRGAFDEQKQLQETIAALRDQLESKNGH
jgi:HAMP domain-containing protein